MEKEFMSTVPAQNTCDKKTSSDSFNEEFKAPIERENLTDEDLKSSV